MISQLFNMLNLSTFTMTAPDILRELQTMGNEKGNTACKVPDAAAYIRSAVERGHLGKKKKMARC